MNSPAPVEKTRNDRILDWAIQKVTREFSRDVHLLVTYGSHLNGTEDAMSDVDFYFVPKTKRAYPLMQTYIIEGVGYDLFPVSWERLEGLANLNESLIPLLGNSKIVFSGSDEDAERFEQLKGLLNKNLTDVSFMHRKAMEKLSQANNTIDELLAESHPAACRLLAGTLLMTLAEVVACENQTYFKNGLKTQLADLNKMGKLPEGFIDGYEAVIKAKTISQLKEACRKTTAACRNFLKADKAILPAPANTNKPSSIPVNINYAQLADTYREIISTFNKVYKYCKNGNAEMAFISGVCLQRELFDGTQGLRLDILSAYDPGDLSKLAASTKAAEAELVECISRGVSIKRYATVDDFIKEN
jgi:hypothetical protein